MRCLPIICLVALASTVPKETQAASQKPSKENLYLQGMALFQQKAFARSAEKFLAVLPMLKREKEQSQAKSRTYHSLTLGQCFTLRKLAQIRWRQGNKELACRRYLEIKALERTLPSGWKTWASASLKRDVLAALRALKGVCQQVPSQVVLRVSPTNAQISQRQGKQWAPTPRRFQTTKQTLRLRFQAKGYQSQERRMVLKKRWQRNTLQVSLKRLPASPVRRPTPRPITPVAPPIRKRPAPALPPTPQTAPFYATWWFWTLTGALVVGATTATVLTLTATQRHTLKGKNEGEYYSLW